MLTEAYTERAIINADGSFSVANPNAEGLDWSLRVRHANFVSWRISRIIWRTKRPKPHRFPMAGHIVLDIVSD
jgi:hypothetical protein